MFQLGYTQVINPRYRMSDLTSIEKMKLEKYLGMETGYVLDFSNRTFQAFIYENIKIDIDDEKYDYASGSKANRLRGFWEKESNFLVGKLIENLIEYWDTRKLIGFTSNKEDDSALRDECFKISNRLRENSLVEHIDAIKPNSDDRDFSILSETIRDMVNKNKPEEALDRLHTFTTKYIRELCDRHGVVWDKSKALHSIYGEYIKKIKEKGLIESIMTERILKTSISVLEAFNDVRNNQSLAHDNPMLNYNESILIFNNVSSTIKFIESIEESIEKSKETKSVEVKWDEIPF